MELYDRFDITGVVQNTRVVLPKNTDSNWRQYVISIATLGKNFNLRTEDVTLYQSVAIGQHVRCTGEFSFFNNVPQFNLSRIELLDE